MLSALPASDDANLRRSARALRSTIATLREAWAASDALGIKDRRSFDAVADASWRALSWRIEAAALLSGTPADEAMAAEAVALREAIFPAGLSFTQLPYSSQWAHSEKLLGAIDATGLAPRIDAVCGAPFLAYVRRAHQAYGRALSITAQANAQEGGGVREPLRRVQVAIAEYTFALFAAFPPSKPSSVGVLKKALAPIDAHRDQRAPALTATPETPAPPAPPPGPSVPVPPVDAIPDVA